MTTSEPCCEDVCLFPIEDVREDRQIDLDGELLRASRIQVGPYSMKLYLAKHEADLLDPNDLGLRLWPGTHAMAYLLLAEDAEGGGLGVSFRDRSILDVGCGTGFVGLLAHFAGAGPVVLSDRPGRALELARLNASVNTGYGNGWKDVKDERNVKHERNGHGNDYGRWKDEKCVKVKALSWGKDAVDETVGESFDVLLLSEVLYVAQPACVPWTLDDADLRALAEMTKAKLNATGHAWVTYGNREGGAEQFQRAAEAAGLRFEEVSLKSIIPSEVLERSAALRRVRIFHLQHLTA